jgi:hypothetical protein
MLEKKREKTNAKNQSGKARRKEETNKPIQDKGDDAEVAKLCGWMLIIDNPYDRHARVCLA